MKYRIIFFLSALVLAVMPFAVAYSDSVASDQIMNADIPFVYGEKDFIERVNAKSEGREPLGLVLSGGSARAFAHIGVLRRMEELGIVPDFIIANSMGSIVGLLYGAGFSPDQIAEITQSTNLSELFKIALPTSGGIIDIGKFSGLLHNYTGRLDLSELPIPVMVLCEDLKTKRQVRIAEGDFMTVMQAAYALPVYFNPVEFDGHLLIDGGIANLVPLDAAYDYSDNVIASTAFYQNPKLNLRNPITNLNVALDIGKSRTGVSQIKEYEPLLIRCNVESFSFMEFGSLPEIQAAGYQSADEMSPELSQLDASGMTAELSELRKELRLKMDRAISEYRHLESIPVLSPTLLLTAELGIFTTTGSPRYLNNDIHVTGGLNFSTGYLNFAAGAGIGTDLTVPATVFPVIDLRAAYDINHLLRVNTAYSLRIDLDGFEELSNPAGYFSSSDVYLGLTFVPLASEHFKLGVLGSAELSLDGIAEPSTYILTTQADFEAFSDALSEENYTGGLILGIQFPNQAYYADADFSLPIPGTDGLIKWNSRGFTRRSLTSDATDSVNYYLRDGMRSSLNAGSFSSVNFASTDILFNPWDFRPTVAEVFMFKEIEFGGFGEIGWFDQFIWSSGISLSLDVSLIGLKPLRLSTFAAYDSLSGGMTGGITIIP